MQKPIPLVLLLHFLIMGIGGTQAQTTVIPAAIAEQFYMQYPYASEMNIHTQGEVTGVYFAMKGERYHAVYKKENWEYTVMKFYFDRLPQKVKTGFGKSPIGAETVSEVAVIYVPSGFETYRIQTYHSPKIKKYHYFSESGRLLNGPPFQDEYRSTGF